MMDKHVSHSVKSQHSNTVHVGITTEKLAEKSCNGSVKQRSETSSAQSSNHDKSSSDVHVGEPPPNIEKNFDVISLPFNFTSKRSPSPVTKGICLFNPYNNGKTPIYDVTEAPFILENTTRFKPLNGRFTISFKELTVPHVRCHFLKQEDDINQKIDEFEDIIETVAVIFINLSDDHILHCTFQSQLNDEIYIKIPMYIASLQIGQSMNDFIQPDDSSCDCQFLMDYSEPCMKKSVSEFKSKNLLLYYLQTVFDKSCMIDQSEFRLITSAFGRQEYMTDENIVDAVNKLRDNLHEIYQANTCILIHLVCQLRKSKESYKLKIFTKTQIDKVYSEILNYMKLSSQDIFDSTMEFHKRGNFDIQKWDNVCSPNVFHNLHIGIISIMQFNKSNQPPTCFNNISIIFKWITAALLFADQCTHNWCCFSGSLQIWKDNIVQLYSEIFFTNEVISGLVQAIVDTDTKLYINLPHKLTFIGSGSYLGLTLKTDSIPRPFSELRIVLLNLHNLMKTWNEFVIFCEYTLNIHNNLWFKLTKERNQHSYAAIAVKENASFADVVKKGFDFLCCIVDCCRDEFLCERVIEKLKDWITFILQFVDVTVTDQRNIDMIANMTQTYKSLLMSSKWQMLYNHFLDEMQMKVKENLKIPLTVFVKIAYIHSAEMVANYFKENQQIQLSTEALSCFSEKFMGASSHQFLVNDFIIPLSSLFAKKNKACEFILQLAEVDVKHLLEIRESNEDDKQAVEEFKYFLKDYIDKHRINFASKFDQIKHQLGSVNNFKRLVLITIAETLCNVNIEKLDEVWLDMLKDIVTCIKKPHSSFEFYWKIISGISDNAIKLISLQNIQKSKVFLVILCEIYSHCGNQELESRSSNFPQIEAHIKVYIHLIDNLKNHLKEWQKSLDTSEVTYDELKEQVTVAHSLNEISNKLAVTYNWTKEALQIKLQNFEQSLSKISEMLIISGKDNWLSLHDILGCYKVKMPDEIIKLIRDFFYFPDETSRLSPNGHLLQSKKCLNQKQLLDLLNKLENFLFPLSNNMAMLKFFHLKESQLFDIFTKSQLPQHISIPPEELATVLKSVKEKFNKIFNGTAKYGDLESVISQIENKNIITREVELISTFLQPDSEKASNNFESMLIFCLIMKKINSLFTFCEDFELKQCLNSEQILKLKEISENFKNKEFLQSQSLNDFAELLREVLALLHLPHDYSLERSNKLLQLFYSLSAYTKELRVFLNENKFRGSGQVRFQQLHALVTQQLQHEEYNTEVLDKLFAVYYILIPLSNPNLSFKELLDTVSKLDMQMCLAQLNTVNSNIDLIRVWFSKAEGDTVANTTAELQCIITNGIFYLTVTAGNSQENVVTLKFQSEKNISFDFNNFSSSDDSKTSTGNVISWSSSDIQDFIRRLGFVDPDKKTTKFVKLNEMVIKIQKLFESLYGMGHSNYTYSSFPREIKCSTITLEKMNKLISECEKDESNLSRQTTNSRKKYKWLSFFTNSRINEIFKLLHSDESIEITACSVIKQLQFLNFKLVDCDVIECIHHIKESEESPMEVIGLFFEKLFDDRNLPVLTQCLKFHSRANLHQCHKYSSQKLIQYLYSINNCFPKSYEILRCCSQTSISDLKLFVQRIKFFPSNYYFLEVNLLTSKLQEFLLKEYIELYEKSIKLDNRCILHFIETSFSILHEAPYISTMTIPQEDVNVELYLKDDINLVYGLQGNGKTYYIKKHLTADNINISVNEAFSIDQVIRKLNTLNSRNCCSVYFNFTLLPPGNNVASEERECFDLLMHTISWFMFDLLVLGYIEDTYSGLTFSISPYKLKFFIEVPSISNDANMNLSSFKEAIPIFCFVGKLVHIDSSITYDVDEDVQLVCKYLNALEVEKSRPKWGINKLYYGDPIRFGNTKDLDPSVCLTLLDKYVPDLIKEHKINQKLFVKYMKRRCEFLDNFPGYNYNQGRNAKGADTSQLGSTLLNFMLKEVSCFCTLSNQNNSLQAHQQLIYEQQEGGCIGLITQNPHQISKEEKKIFDAIQLEIPTISELYTREVLDKYLARALSLPLAAVTVTGATGVTHYKRLKIIDDAKYVLTLDYALKMININERKECGMPVIIEGETGVGKTELLKLLSKLWNYKFVMQWNEKMEKLTELLFSIREKRNLKIKTDSSLDQLLAALKISFQNDDKSSDISSLKKVFMELHKNPLLSILQPKSYDAQNINFWEFMKNLDDSSYNNPEIICKFLRLVLTTEISTFHKLDVHSGLRPLDVISFFNEVIEQAEQIKTMFITDTPQVIAYLDEVNTSSCMGLFKEIIVDKSIDGEPIPGNVFIIAACNPLRGDSTAVLRKNKNVWIKPSYYVRQLHPTIEFLKWDYGALNDTQEKEYVTAKMEILTEDESIDCLSSEQLIFLIVESQKKIRKYAYETLLQTSDSLTVESVWQCSRSCVSQRDMQRVFDFYKWSLNRYEEFQRFSDSFEQKIRAVLVSLGIVYYLRLGEEDRKNYAQFLDGQCELLQIVSFTKALQDELDWYMERLTLPPGIAKTNALKENIFATIICCQTHTPLIIIGEPGTSKTLSFNLVTGTFKGKASTNSDFKQFYGLQPYFYQCSQHTTSHEIQNLFYQAIKRQKTYANSNVPTYCVVFMDEAGLPEERHESLKVLHYHLDKRETSFVAITNHALDAAKTNRAISLYRPETSNEDLQLLAFDLLDSINPITEPERKNVIAFCESFCEMLKNIKFKNFHGQRDFLHFINHLRKRRGNGLLTPNIVLEALERNFNGLENFQEVFNYFLKKMDVSYDDMYQRSVLQIAKESFANLPSNVPHSNQQEMSYIEHGVRYKLIIDNSEDDSAVRYLFACGILNEKETQMYACSDFPEESGMWINTVAKIIHSAERGHTILMFQTEKIHESFYELFNQRFRILDDPKKGVRFFTNISIGAHTKACRVDSQFQCIVVVKESERKNTPQAFLSRFEKFFFSYKTLYQSIIFTKPPNMKIIVKTVYDKILSLVENLQSSESFFGYTIYTPQLQEISDLDNSVDPVHETLYSLLLSLLPSFNHEYKLNSKINECKEFEDNCMNILATALNSLRTEAGWVIPELPKEEMQFDCQHIFKLLENNCSFSEAISSPEFDLKGAVGEALGTIYIDTGQVEFMGNDSCLVVAVIVHWLIIYVAKRLFHVLTPESLVVNAKTIPKFLIEAYFKFQEHFNLKRLIEQHLCKIRQNKNNTFCVSKILIYSRDSRITGLLPSSYPTKELTDDTILHSIITVDIETLVLMKLTSDVSEGEIEKCVVDFIESPSKSILLLIGSMKELTIKMINFLRVLIEQHENQLKEKGDKFKLIAILLQFPLAQFFNRCYPVLFLNGWDHIYLDSLTTDLEVPGIPKPLQNIVNIKMCFHKALNITDDEDAFILNMEPLLEEAIPVVSSRIVTGSSGNRYNKSMPIIKRQKLLRELLIESADKNYVTSTPIGKAFCSLFHKYWDDKTVVKFLQDASHFAFHNLSTLSITSYIQTKVKALFFEFVVYMLWKINEDCNLDTYFSLSNLDNLFSNVIGSFFPKLPNLASLSYICINLSTPINKGFEFPFFGMVYSHMEELLDECQQIVLRKTDAGTTKVILKKLEQDIFLEMKTKLKNQTHIISSIVLSLKDKDLWAKYLQDFLKFKYMSNNTSSSISDDDNTAFKLVLPSAVSAYFDFESNVESGDPVGLLAWIHVRAELHKADLAQIISKIHQLESFIRSHPHESISSLAKLQNQNFGTFVINVAYQSLDNIITEKNDEKLKQWYVTYRDIIQTTSLYNSLHDVTDPQFNLYFFKAHVMYVLIHFSNNLMSESLQSVITLYNDHILKIPHSTKLKDILMKCVSVLKTRDELYKISVLDNLLSFMFYSPLTHCDWYISQIQLPSTDSLLNLLSFNQRKHYLQVLLKASEFDEKTVKDSNDELKLFHPKVRHQIGLAISSVDPKVCIDAFKNVSNSNNMHILIKMYLMIVYKELCTSSQFSDDMKILLATKKLKTLFENIENCSDAANRNLLIIEREAFMQRFLGLISIKLAHNANEILIGRLITQIDTLLNADFINERGLILCMNLYKEIKNEEKFIRKLESLPNDKLTCLNKFKQEIIGAPASVDFSLPLLISKDSELGKFYVQICKLLKKIQSKEAVNLKEFVAKFGVDAQIEVDFTTGNKFKILKKKAFCMCVWLCSYYEFYQKDVQSNHLANVINTQLEGIFPDEVIKLIICFINKNLVKRQLEQNTPTDVNAPLYVVTGSLRFNPIQQRGQKIDPIYKLFFPEIQDKNDIHDKLLCNGLATMIAAVLACPDYSTHLWYHIFSPGDLLKSYVTGFLFDSELTEGRLYDCGVVLSEEGDYGRPEYLPRADKGIMNLHSLYHLLWLNFGAFCIHLLVQNKSRLAGTVISEYQAIRHYCKSQLSSMWLHMCVNLKLNDEQISLLIIRSMQRHIQICYQKPEIHGLFEVSESRDDYERMWHTQVFTPSLEEVKDKDKLDYYATIIQSTAIISQLRSISSTYPYVPTIKDFTYYLHQHCSQEQSRQFDVLLRFVHRYRCLQAGGMLLPSLIEFYQWIVTDLSYSITRKKATDCTLSDAVALAVEKYSKELKIHYIELFESVSKMYNNYLKVIDFSIGAGACANVKRENRVPLINVKSRAFNFLPGETNDEKEEERDFLFLVIEDIVNFHNSFLSEMRHLISAHLSLQKYIFFPDGEQETLLHPSAVNDYSCILGNYNNELFLQLICKYQSNHHDGRMFEIEKIQEETVAHFIAGKLEIDDCQTKLRKSFHFKFEEVDSQVKIIHPTDLMLTLQQIEDIDDDFKTRIPEENDFLIALEFELFSLKYEILVEMALALKTITEHVKQKLAEEKIIKADIIDLKVGDVLPMLVYGSKNNNTDNPHEVFDELGMKRLQDSQRLRIADIPMRCLFTTLEIIIKWINEGIYNFHTLPKSMKCLLKKEDRNQILALHKNAKINANELLNKLKSIEEVLMHSEQYFINNIDQIKENNIFQCLKDISLINDDDDQFIRCLPKDLKVENYMFLRICLRKAINSLQDNNFIEDEICIQWHPHVDDLWSEDKLEHLSDAITTSFDIVYNPVTGLYGFDQDEALGDSDSEVSVEEDVSKEQTTVIDSGKPLEIQAESQKDDLSSKASELNPDDICNYLRSLKLDGDYTDKFIENEVDGDMMFDMDDEILQSLGVTTGKDRLKIKSKFKQWLRNFKTKK